MNPQALAGPFRRALLTERRSIWSKRYSNITTTTSVSAPPPIPEHTPIPPPSGVRFVWNRTKESFLFVARFKSTLFDLFLWMVCGSLALEQRWMKRDLEEYKETVGVRRRKLEKELETLKLEVGMGTQSKKSSVKASPKEFQSTSSSTQAATPDKPAYLLY
ncbi:hypothetical protein HDU85_007692 [Gaertneriomyces sp. JEL0708]|nr:hypothetical protein HDU85_007692 [Gaertneriomyces sp. JEL0708]